MSVTENSTKQITILHTANNEVCLIVPKTDFRTKVILHQNRRDYIHTGFVQFINCLRNC